MNKRMLLEKAIAIAVTSHRGQVDKYKQPTIMHVLRVMNFGVSWEEKVSGVLHDLIEDTKWTCDQLRAEGFPEEVVEVVDLLTKAKGADYKKYLKKIAANPVAIRVKLNDLRDNMDMTRMTEAKEKDVARINKYIAARNYLYGKLGIDSQQ